MLTKGYIMGNNIHFCKNCFNNNKSLIFATPEKNNYYRGFMCFFSQENLGDICPVCKTNGLVETNITEEELKTIGEASNYSTQLLDAMRALKDKDIIEYELKLSQFRNNIKSTTKQGAQIDYDVKCPHCGSSSITTGARGVNGFWGFIGASKTVNRCAKCGYTWKP